MRIVLQRVTRAGVRVEGRVTGEIGSGYVALVGIGAQDAPEEVQALADKVVHLRVFADDDGKMNRSLLDLGGEALVVSQFTLYADTRKGRRPSFTAAADPEPATEHVEAFARALEERGVRVERGTFGAHMEVELLNDGPVTIVLDGSRPAPG